jgi:hypothetical protein
MQPPYYGIIFVHPEEGKVTLFLLQAAEASRLVRRRVSHIC